jgi:hypothetical protein
LSKDFFGARICSPEEGRIIPEAGFAKAGGWAIIFLKPRPNFLKIIMQDNRLK